LYKKILHSFGERGKMSKVRKDQKLYPYTAKDEGNFVDMLSHKQNSVLKQMRLARGLTLSELAEIAGVCTSYAYRIENNDRRWNADTLSKFAKALGVSEIDLLKNNQDFSIANVSATTYIPTKDLPEFKTTSGFANPNGDSPYAIGHFDEPLRNIFRLPQLIGIKGAFAFCVVDDLNEPKYRKGDLVFVNPEKATAKHCPVVAITSKNEIVLGRLDHWDDDAIKLSHYGKIGVIGFERSQLRGIYSVLGSFDNYVAA
jgi:transcriptional regulator with XRE-family HTH domain